MPSSFLKSTSRLLHTTVAAVMVLLPGSPPEAQAQSALEFSEDGYRWVEFDVTIFRNQFPADTSTEISNPDRLHLGYLPRLRRLTSAAASLQYPFPDPVPGLPNAAAQQTNGFLPFPVSPGSALAADLQPVLAEKAPAYTARYSPALPDAFRIADLSREPFIALPVTAPQYAALERRIEAAPEYQVLWHQTWRQPLLPRSQVASILVEAGTLAGKHHELEGSLRFSDNGAGLAQIDVNLWLNIFGELSGKPAASWQLPELPQALQPVLPADKVAAAGTTVVADTGRPAEEPRIETVWQQETNRDIGGNTLYYLDHPVIGVLIQARSYRLPVTDLPDDEADF